MTVVVGVAFTNMSAQGPELKSEWRVISIPDIFLALAGADIEMGRWGRKGELRGARGEGF